MLIINSTVRSNDLLCYFVFTIYLFYMINRIEVYSIKYIPQNIDIR